MFVVNYNTERSIFNDKGGMRVKSQRILKTEEGKSGVLYKAGDHFDLKEYC